MKKINEAFNTLVFSLKSKENLSVLVNKIKTHFGSDKEIKVNDENINWIKKNCSDYSLLANSISPALWKESLQFSDELHERSNKILESKPKLGGGGIYPFLYFVTRLTKPGCIVETGVAAGYSSQTFLSAINRNGKGFLYSSDFPYFRLTNPEAHIGILVEEELKKNWKLFIKGDQVNLPQILDVLNAIDIFHYDSDKSYNGRVFATELVQKKLAKGSLLIYDDIQDNAHFNDFINAHAPEEWYIFEFEKKYVGFVGGISKYKTTDKKAFSMAAQ